MTVGEMLGGGTRLVRTQPKALALCGLLYLAAMGAMWAMLWPMMTEMTAFQQQAMAAAASGTPPPAAPMPGFMGGVFLMELVLVVVIVAIFAAAVRATVRGGEGGSGDRFGFLRLGMDELRLIGLVILLWLIATGGMIVFMIAAGLVTALLQAAIGDSAGFLLVPLWLVLMLGIVWAEVRISLAGAFTVLHGRITIRPAWRATRGAFWTLLGAYLVIGLVFVVVGLALTAILFPQLFGFYAAAFRSTDPAAILAAQQALFAGMAGPRMIVAMLVGTVVNTALVAWLFGAIATAAVALDSRAYGAVA